MDKLFEKSLTILSKIFNITEEELMNSTNHKIGDARKLLVLKFYELKQPNDNITNYLKNKFNCYHSNIVYWHNKAKELCAVDIEFQSKYRNYSDEIDEYINLNK